MKRFASMTLLLLCAIAIAAPPLRAAAQDFGFEPPADAVYAVIRADLEKAGRPIAANDLLIAAHAVCLGHTLVTDNARDFSRIGGLSAENWLP